MAITQGSNFPLEKVYELLKSGESLDKKYSYSHPKKTNSKSVVISLGRIWFNEVLPDDYEFINEPVDKKKLDSIVKNILDKYDSQTATKIIADIQKEAFKLAALRPSSIRIDAFIPSDDWIKMKDEFVKKADSLDPIEFGKEAEKITKELIKEIQKKGIRIQNVMESGTKGNPVAEWKALLVAKGYVVDVEGNVLGPIKHGLADGYDKEEYYNAAAEARRGFYLKSSMTKDPGYLARKVAMANSHLVIDDSKPDCGTTKYFVLKVTNDIADRILERYYKSGSKLVKIESADELIGTEIKMRSPLHCIAKNGICPTCYGDFYKKLGTKHIGILSGGVINVIALNALMKQRHKASQFALKEVDFPKMLKDHKEFDLIFEMEKNKLIAKTKLKIIFNMDEYDEGQISDLGEYFITPGIIDIYVENDKYTLPFDFNVKVHKPESYDEDSDIHTLIYEEGETVISQDYYSDDFDISVLSKYLEGGMKYVNNPETLVTVLANKLKTVDLVHLELIVSNMFRDANDVTLPARLTGYKNFVIYGQKKLPFVTSWTTSIAFENINKAVQEGLIRQGKLSKKSLLDDLIFKGVGNES